MLRDSVVTHYQHPYSFSFQRIIKRYFIESSSKTNISLLLAASLHHRFYQSRHFTSKWLLAILPIHYGCNCHIVCSRVCTIAKSDSFAPSSSAALSVHPSVRMEQLCSHWRDFHCILYFVIFRKSAQKVQISFNPTRITGTLHAERYTIYNSYLSEFFLEWEMFKTKDLEKIETHIFMLDNVFSKIVPFMR
jgi:hypothetical protein